MLLVFNISFIEIKRLFCCFYFCHCQSFCFLSSFLHWYHNFFKFFLFNTWWNFFWLKSKIKFFLFFFLFFLHHLLKLHSSCWHYFFSFHRFKRLWNSYIKFTFSCFWDKINFFIDISLLISLKSIKFWFVVFFRFNLHQWLIIIIIIKFFFVKLSFFIVS